MMHLAQKDLTNTLSSTGIKLSRKLVTLKLTMAQTLPNLKV
jgi:hypothetical protein